MIALLSWASALYTLASCLLLVGMVLRWVDTGIPVPGKVVLWALVAPAVLGVFMLLHGVLFLVEVLADAVGYVADAIDVSPPEGRRRA